MSDPLLPGQDLVDQGLADLKAGEWTPAALLAAMAAPRLRRIGVEVPAIGEGDWGHRLYDALRSEDPATAHRRYNALIGRIVSFARAAEHARSG